MDVLVTGVSGFVGGAIARRLLREGHRVAGLYRDVPYPSWPPEQRHSYAVFGDVTDRDLLYRTLVDYGVEIIVHQAAHSIVAKCEEDPWSAYRVNVMGSVALLDAARMYGRVKKILFATTDKVYGDGPVPYREDQPLDAKGPYSASKLCADVIARDYCATYGLPVMVVRSSNIYGPGDRDETRVIPRNIVRLLRGEPALIYSAAFGMHREFVYIDDEVEAYMTLLTRGDPGVYNVGGSGPVPVADVVRKLADLCGGTTEVIDQGFREINNQYVDASRLNSLGWEQKVPLDAGLARTVAWFANILRKPSGPLAEPMPVRSN